MTSIASFRAYSQQLRLMTEAQRADAEKHYQYVVALRRRQVAAVVTATQSQSRVRSLIRLLADHLLALEAVDQDGTLSLVDAAETSPTYSSDG
jgi:hypothetical protein